MPLPEIYGEIEYDEYVGQLVDLREQDGNYGLQIVAEFKEVDPDALSPRLEFFPAKRSSKSGWMKFLNEAGALGYSTKNPNDLAGNYFHIQKRPETYTFEEEDRIITKDVPHIKAITPDEGRAKEIWEEIVASKPKTVPELDIGTESELIALYKGVKQNDNVFLAAVEEELPQGMTAEEALTLVKSRLRVE
jgi:hypothetical protein